MTAPTSRLRRASFALLTAGTLLLAGTAPAIAQTPFGQIDKTSTARVSFASAESGKPIEAGSQVNVNGQGFKPGQRVTLFYGSAALNSAPLVADAEGKVTTTIAIPAAAVSGTHPIVVVADAPYAAIVAELKVSPTVPLSGQQNFTITQAEETRGLYQSAYSAKNNVLFTASAVGRPPISQSEVLKLDADKLNVIARATPPEAPAPQRPAGPPPGGQGGPGGNQPQGPGVFAVYGIGVDDTKGTVWATNTRQNTIAVYNQSDLSLVKQFPVGTVPHSRDVVIDETLGKAYASATGTPDVVVIDTGSLDVAKTISIQTPQRGAAFSALSLSLDRAAHKLYTVSMTTNEVAVINTQTDTVEKIIPVPGAISAIGVSHDPQTGRIFVASQGSDNLIVLDGNTGAVIADTPVGAGALNVVFDPVKRLAYVANRNAGTITVVDPNGKIVANLGPAPLANHVSLGSNGVIYAVDKSAGQRDAEADVIMRIQPK
ncbi:MAG TPA: YncE family protein [Croceibacterium sp.]|nr:YncE family protein [Croceibacterium sp.]